MNKYIERFLGTKSSLQRKVIVIYLLVAVLPIIIITLFISAIYYNNILKAANTLLDQNAGQHEEVVHERMDEYENVLYELVTNKEYISLSKRINEGNEDTLIMDVGHMEDLLRSSVTGSEALHFWGTADDMRPIPNGTAATMRISGSMTGSGRLSMTRWKNNRS